MPLERSIDHIVFAVRDLSLATMSFDGLGFTLTPRAHHPDRMGTSNQLIQFAGMNYIELLEVDRPDGIDDHEFDTVPPEFSFGGHNRTFLQDRTGMSLLVLKSDNARADLAQFDALGLTTYAPFDFQRQAVLSDGSLVTVAFTLGFVTCADLPGLAFSVCQHHTPEHFWKPYFQAHSNGAHSIAAIYMVAQDPVKHVEFLTKLTGGRATEIDGGQRISCGDQELLVLTPERVGAIAYGLLLDPIMTPRFAGLALTASEPELVPVQAKDNCNAFIVWRRN